MITTIRKWGNSLGLRIPKAVAVDVDVREGTAVDLKIEQGRLVLAPVRRVQLSLEELLEEVTPENLHGEVDTGPAVGREVW